MRAAEQAARQLDLPRSWMNESVAMYARRLEQDGDRIFVGVYPTPERIGLRLVAAKPAYILAMKLNALERSTADDRDFQDTVAGTALSGGKTVSPPTDARRGCSSGPNAEP